jgi:hypothetical protein
MPVRETAIRRGTRETQTSKNSPNGGKLMKSKSPLKAAIANKVKIPNELFITKKILPLSTERGAFVINKTSGSSKN